MPAGIRDAGKVIALARHRRQALDTAPEVPTFKELGYDGFDDLRVSNGLLAPKGTPNDDHLAFEPRDGEDEQERPDPRPLVEASYDPGVMSPAEYGEMIDRELKQWGAIVKETGVQIKT